MNNKTLFGITVPLSAAGVLLFTLAPLALPILVLTIVATVPLLLAGLAVALVVAVIAAPFAIVRRLLGRRASYEPESMIRWPAKPSRWRIPRAS